MSGDTFYITTPIYYVNGNPHIGHAYTSIAADAAARYQRLRGMDVRFLTGTDEHGQKVLEAAEARGKTPQEHVDELSMVWKEVIEGLDVEFDRWIRTTDADHEAMVSAVLQQLFDRGEIYKAEYEGWYLVKDEVFVTDKDRERQIEDGELAESDFRRIKEANYFFRMGKYQQALIDHIEANPGFIQPESRRNEVLGFLRKPLEDLCISRPKARMSWGIELPFDADFVTYVWFDALLNYLTGAGFRADGSDDFRHWWPCTYHLIGKDILTTHCVYWTTMLLAMEVPLPECIYAHGWWVSNDGGKIGKSEGNAIEVGGLCEAFGVDAVRFFVLREIRFGADGGFTYDGFLGRYNTDLANDFGNLAHRGLSMTEKWLGGVVPTRAAPDPELLEEAARVVHTFDEAMGALQFDRALEAVFGLVRAGNKYIDRTEPWALNKRGETDALRQVKRDVLEISALAGILLSAVMPTKAPELLRKLGLEPADTPRHVQRLLGGAGVLDLLTEGAKLELGDPLFPRFRKMPEPIASLLAPAEEPGAEAEVPLPSDIDWIEFPDFAKLTLKVGEVLEAQAHPNADTLLVMKVEVGEARPRTICAGIKSAFDPADLVGRRVVVVANLKPRKLRGVASEGMVLAASNADGVVDLVTAAAGAGDRVS